MWHGTQTPTLTESRRSSEYGEKAHSVFGLPLCVCECVSVCVCVAMCACACVCACVWIPCVAADSDGLLPHVADGQKGLCVPEPLCSWALKINRHRHIHTHTRTCNHRTTNTTPPH